jgi:4-hydroxy-tetrahydrodipicolinate synthase
MINILPPAAPASDHATSREHVTAILSAVQPTPAIVQLIPAAAGATLDVAGIAMIAESAPNLFQVKVESRPAGAFIGELRNAAPRLTCLVGSGGVDLPDAVRQGAVGVQPGCSAVEIYLRYWRLWSAGEIAAADALHRRLHPFLVYWMQDVELIVAAEKRISFLRGLIPTDVCRRPARVLTRDDLVLVDRFLDEFSDELGQDHHSANEPSS